MKKPILPIFVYAICSLTISYSQEKLQIEGAIIINNSEYPTPVPGTIRFNSTTNDFEGWNGIYWASLTGNQYEPGEMTDQDGNTYPTIIIGTQEWMAKNLRTTTFVNGNAITLIVNDAAGDAACNAANYGACCVYDTFGTGYQSFDVNEFGYLYNWYAVNDGRDLCPTGWHIPTDLEWTTLIDYLDSGSVDPNATTPQSLVAGGLMKEAGTSHWNSPNTAASNESGFTGLPGGYRDFPGSFDDLGRTGYWRSSTESGGNAWYRFLDYFVSSVYRNNLDKRTGLSVRCVSD